MEKVEYWLSRDGKKFTSKEECSRYEELNLTSDDDLQEIKKWIITIGTKEYPLEDFEEVKDPIEYPTNFGETYTWPRYQDPCAHCMNNPKNNPHASGVCNCVLPYVANPMYWSI